MQNISSGWPIYVGWSTRLNCRGVLAARDINKGEVVEVCPILLIPHKTQKGRLNRQPTNSLLDNYYYDWDRTHWCLPLGYAVLYNHSYQPNLVYLHDTKNLFLKYKALIDIKKDEELCVNYNGDPADSTPVDTWFHEYSGRIFE